MIGVNGCFYCRNNRVGACTAGLDQSRVTDGPESVLACEKGDPQFGFQIGGYYRHMYFEGGVPVFPGGGSRIGGCLEWHIEGDADFPQGEDMELHLCEWQQLEEWVAFWGKVLRARGWVVDEPEEVA